MSKQATQQTVPKKQTVPNRDGFSRASYLYQAAHATRNEALSRMLTRSMDLVTKRSVLKVSPHLRRTVCKRCDRLQVPGISCTISLEDEGKKSETLQIKCRCGRQKRYAVGQRRDYVLFADRPV